MGCLQYSKSTIFQANHNERQIVDICRYVVCNTAKVRFFKQITTYFYACRQNLWLFAIQQKYDFSSKSQRIVAISTSDNCCLQYSKSTIFQANHNIPHGFLPWGMLFAIQQKYDFSSKSQHDNIPLSLPVCCLQYCKSTIFQANHNTWRSCLRGWLVVCDTAKARFFKQITTIFSNNNLRFMLKSSWLLMVRWIGWSLFSLCGKTKINILLMHKVLDEDTIKTWNIAPSCLWQNVFVFQNATWRKLFHAFSTSWKPGCQ